MMIRVRDASETLTNDLLRYAEHWCGVSRQSLSKLGKEAVKDQKYLHNVAGGLTAVSLKKYDQIVKYIDNDLNKMGKQIASVGDIPDAS